LKYFTPELIEQLNSTDRIVANAADAEWDRRLEQYESDLQRISHELPEHIREFNSLLLHDARVCGMGRNGTQFIMMVHKDIPPRDLVILTYAMIDQPCINREVLPPGQRSVVMDLLYDEFDLHIVGGERHYTQSILFSNGWELRLCFRDVKVTLAQPIYPASRMTGNSMPESIVSQIA
jgi:hypothetical protein